MLRTGALVLLVAAIVLSGCASKPPQPAKADPYNPASSGAPAGNATASAFGVLHNKLPAYTSKVVWANGTVAAQDTCNTGGCITDTSRATHVTDLTPDLPAGAPVHVQVALTYSPNCLFGGGFEAVLTAVDTTFYAYNEQNDFSGHETLDAILLPGGQVKMTLWAYSPGGGAPDTPYTLSASIDASPEFVPPGVPMAAQLGPGNTVLVSSNQDKAGSFLLYAPDDHLVGIYERNVTLPASAAKGAYALMLPSGAAWANFTTDNADHNMTPLGLSFVPGALAELPPHGFVDQPYDVQGVPLGVGAVAYSKDNGAVAPLASNGFTLSMKGPDSFVLPGGTFCNLCLTFGFGVGIQSQLGDERIIPGTYTVHAETTATYDLLVQPYAIFLKR